MMRRKTPEEYVKECKEKGLDLPVENYINNSTKIEHKCSKGHIYPQRPDAHLNGQGCPTCSGNKQKTNEEYIQECKEKRLDLPVEDYINNKTMIRYRCEKGHIYPQTPNAHLRGQGCPKCSGKYSYTPEEYYNLCKDKGLDLPIEDYINTRTKINHKCSKGHIYSQTPNKHLRGYGCPKCKKCYSYTPKEYYNLCKDKGLDLPIEGYINTKIEINHKCSKGHIYPQRPCNHLQGQGCPICNESKGERFIRNYLARNNINYISQKRFQDLKDKTYLSYDFYLPEHNMLIEYQGIQHFESISFNGKDYSDLDKQKHHDRLKQRFAKDNGYKLLRPTYKTDTQEKINKYLDRYLVE